MNRASFIGYDDTGAPVYARIPSEEEFEFPEDQPTVYDERPPGYNEEDYE